jgi:integrase
MRVFRQKYRSRDGKLAESSKWYVEFRDHREKVQRVPGYVDKGATKELGRKLERLASVRGAGDVPDAELLRWLETVPHDLRDRMVKLDLIDGRSNIAGRTLAEHVADFKANMEHRKRTAAHVGPVVHRTESILNGCGFRFVSDISASRVEAYLAELRDRGLSAQTVNHYLRAVKQFCRWLVTDRRATENALEHLEIGRTADDVRRERRELTEAELSALLSATRSGPSRFGLTGWERFTLYAVAVGTGLRASELASLTRQSFDMKAGPPTVTIEPENEKARRGDTLPLSSDLVALLMPWLASLPPDAKLWPGKWAAYKQASRFMQLDLAAARAEWLAGLQTTQERIAAEKSDFLCYRDAEGRQIDFHALRHTFLSRLGRAGVPAKVMQRLARHSTVELTLGRYTHANVFDLAAGVDSLPPLPINPTKSERQAVRATGTDHHTADAANVLPSCLPEMVANQRARMHQRAVKRKAKSTAKGDAENEETAGKTRVFPTVSSGEGGIRTLGELAPTLVFETSTIGHSVTSPSGERNRRGRQCPLSAGRRG